MSEINSFATLGIPNSLSERSQPASKSVSVNTMYKKPGAGPIPCLFPHMRMLILKYPCSLGHHMKPLPGIIAEVFVLAVLLTGSRAVPAGLYFGLYVVLVQLLSPLLIHCPAHYVVGTAGGIKFRELRFGRTSLVRVLPANLRKIASLIPILTLATEKHTVSKATPRKAAAMFAAGAVASAGSPLLIAAVATLAEPFVYSAFAWVVAIGYLLFDVVFSPRGGDLMRAAEVLKPSRLGGRNTRAADPSAM